MLLSQQQYILDILDKASMATTNSVTTLMPSKSALYISDGTPFASASQFRQIVGCLQYLSLTHPDIAFSVNKLSQFMHKPTDVYWIAANRLLRYLHSTVSYGLFLKKYSPLQLHAFSDAD